MTNGGVLLQKREMKMFIESIKETRTADDSSVMSNRTMNHCQ